MANVQYIAFSVFFFFFPVFCSRTGFLPSSPLGFKKPETQSAAGPPAS